MVQKRSAEEVVIKNQESARTTTPSSTTTLRTTWQSASQPIRPSDSTFIQTQRCLTPLCLALTFTSKTTF